MFSIFLLYFVILKWKFCVTHTQFLCLRIIFRWQIPKCNDWVKDTNVLKALNPSHWVPKGLSDCLVTTALSRLCTFLHSVNLTVEKWHFLKNMYLFDYLDQIFLPMFSDYEDQPFSKISSCHFFYYELCIYVLCCVIWSGFGSFKQLLLTNSSYTKNINSLKYTL